nr:BON domain-containing protein [Luteimonas sp. BDR2-5]
MLLAPAITAALLFAGSVSAQERADHDDHKDHTVAANTESDQPVSDTWITTKVKADLLASSHVSGLDIGVETANGTVSLSGEVDNQAQIDRATEIARGIKGVTSVDTSQLQVKPAAR